MLPFIMIVVLSVVSIAILIPLCIMSCRARRQYWDFMYAWLDECVSPVNAAGNAEKT